MYIEDVIKMKFVKKLLITLFIIAFIAVSVIIYLGYNMYKNVTAEVSISDKISKIESSANYTPIEEIPESFKNAIIATEDHRFRDHNGFDMIAFCRAIITNVKDGELSEGASTITQQLGRNMYFTQEKLFTRKIAELFVAFDIESYYFKDKILEFYINTIYYGNGYTGIKKASQGYFNKAPSELTLYEATLLAGLPNAPSAYSPTKHLDLAHKRQNQVLNSMVREGYLSEEEKERSQTNTKRKIRK